MRKFSLLVLPVLFLTIATALPAGRQGDFPDITGTWVGETDFPASPEKDPVTLVLKKEGNSYAGTIAVGKTKEVAIKNLRIDDEDSFSFEFVLTLGNKISPVKAKLDVISDIVLGTRLMGSWYLDDGSYGTMDLSLKK